MWSPQVLAQVHLFKEIFYIIIFDFLPVSDLELWGAGGGSGPFQSKFSNPVASNYGSIIHNPKSSKNKKIVFITYFVVKFNLNLYATKCHLNRYKVPLKYFLYLG